MIPGTRLKGETRGERTVQRKVDAFFDEAEAALARNDWTTALGRARAVLAIGPQNPDARIYFDAAERGVASGSTGVTSSPAGVVTGAC